MITAHNDDECTLKIDRTTNIAPLPLSKTENTIKQKFSYTDWATIEQTLHQKEIDVLKMLIQYIKHLLLIMKKCSYNHLTL